MQLLRALALENLLAEAAGFLKSQTIAKLRMKVMPAIMCNRYHKFTNIQKHNDVAYIFQLLLNTPIFELMSEVAMDALPKV